MTFRSASVAFLYLLACLTNVVSAQTGYDHSLGVPQAVAYPQAQSSGSWNVGSPLGFVAAPRHNPRLHVMPNPLAPTAVGYTPMVASPTPTHGGNYAMPQQQYLHQAYAAPNMSATAAVGYMPMVASPSPVHVGNFFIPQYPHQAYPTYLTPNMSAPTAVGYMPMAASPPPMSVGYQAPTVAPQSYWTELRPVAGSPAAVQPAEAGRYFAPTRPPASMGPQYSHVSYGPTFVGPNHTSLPSYAIRREGSVLGPSSLTNLWQAPSGPQVDPPMFKDQVIQQGPVNSGAIGVSVGSKMRGLSQGHGQGKAKAGCGASCCTSPWFGGFGGVLMSRDNENDYRFSYDGADESIQLTNAPDANFDWAGGLEVSLGRTFHCGRNAVEFVYWGLYPAIGSTTTTDTDVVGALNGILNWDQLDYGLDPFLVPWTADDFANNSTMHMVQRENTIHNFEFNLLSYLGGGCGPTATYIKGDGSCGGCAACGGAAQVNGNGLLGGRLSLNRLRSDIGKGGNAVGCGSRWSHEWLVGVRYFEFRDHLLFGAERSGGNYDFRFEDDEIYYNIDVRNELVGLQLGSSGAYAVSCRCSLDYDLKFGLYANKISHTSEIGGSQGIATINNGPNLGVDFYVQNTKNDVAMLAEAKLGISWQLGNSWSAKLGYRAVAVTGVALPTNQIYHDLRGIQDVRLVDSNGSLILHGGYARCEFQF